jgi:cAMP-specific phosphodiesterase 4
MLNKELSHLSESSKSGNQISEYICSTFLGEFSIMKGKQVARVEAVGKKPKKMFCRDFVLKILFKITDKQQEVDVQTFDQAQPPQTSSNPQRMRAPRTMSQISGFKRPLMHTNSFTSDRLPLYGVETPHEATLGAMLNDVSTWGIDIFKIGTLSCNRPLTCVAYQIFQVRRERHL